MVYPKNSISEDVSKSLYHIVGGRITEGSEEPVLGKVGDESMEESLSRTPVV